MAATVMCPGPLHAHASLIVRRIEIVANNIWQARLSRLRRRAAKERPLPKERAKHEQFNLGHWLKNVTTCHPVFGSKIVTLLSLSHTAEAAVLSSVAKTTPEDKTRNEVLGARVGIYMAAKKWNMAAAVASHLVKVDPGTAGWWISLAYALRRTESVEKAEAILLRAQTIHPKVAMIAFNLACYASVTGRIEDAKARLRHAIELDKDIRELALDDEDLKPLWNWIASLE
jgi:tetratricopeptide (TPR) repeat protein